MRFTPQFLDELRARLPVSEVVGRRVKLQKAGREWKGLSPFNKEKTPSFFVNDQKQAWFDFSSGKNGDIFDFVMETEGVDVPRSGRAAGAAWPACRCRSSPRKKKRATRSARRCTTSWSLRRNSSRRRWPARAGAKARGYLADRALDAATQLKFRIGYAPARALRAEGASRRAGRVGAEDMVEAGLLIAGDDIPVPYDRFRDRVMFPITDLRGRIIAFGGRALDQDAPAKYLNSPETPLFHKGSNLYNGAAARQAVHDGAPLIVVEGYVDVIAMVTAGYPATVAPLGTALTEDQLGLLWKMADEPILCFDGDKAGQRAAYPRGRSGAAAAASPARACASRCCPRGRTPTISIAPAGARRSPRCSAARGRSPRCCGRARPRRRRSTRRSAARRFEARVHEVVRSDRRRIGAQILRAGFRGAAARS